MSALAIASPAVGAARKPRPRVATGSVSHVRGTSALLEGSVNPRGFETTYYFQYGPTNAYGAQTTPGNAGSGSVSVKVGQMVTGFLPGYHYRLVAKNANGASMGRDRLYTTKSTKLKLELTKFSEPVTFGSPVLVTGILTGVGAANHKVALTSSPFPYLAGFASLSLPTVPNSVGRFSFPAGVLRQNTQFRASTLDSLPVFSPVLTVHVAVRVSLKVRSAGHAGLVRLYGTVQPAEVGAKVLFQLQRPARPGRTERSEEKTVRYVTQSVGAVKRATRSASRFSRILNVRRTGRYRALVVLAPGPLVSGASPTVVLHAPKGRRVK